MIAIKTIAQVNEELVFISKNPHVVVAIGTQAAQALIMVSRKYTACV